MTTSALYHRGEQVEAHGLVLLASLIEGKPALPRLALLLLYCDESRVHCCTIDKSVRGPGGKGIDQNSPPLPILELRVFSLDRMLCVCEASPRPCPPPRAWPFFGFWVWPWGRGVMTDAMLWRYGVVRNTRLQSRYGAKQNQECYWVFCGGIHSTYVGPNPCSLCFTSDGAPLSPTSGLNGGLLRQDSLLLVKTAIPRVDWLSPRGITAPNRASDRSVMPSRKALVV